MIANVKETNNNNNNNTNNNNKTNHKLVITKTKMLWNRPKCS